ncbi:hypothetical protein [Nocardia brasiliensis]
MVRVSEHYQLPGDQGTFDFVDVDIDRDTRLFIDPTVLASINEPWAHSCVSAVQSFFQEVLDRIRAGKKEEAKNLLSFLSEDNSTRLGYSSRSQGSGVGDQLAEKFYDDLAGSSALASGLITDIEDTALLIDGVREDRISDVVTNIIRSQLADYTRTTAEFYGIPLKHNVALPPYWDPVHKRWASRYYDVPIAGKGPILLVPKSIVRRLLVLDPGEYYRHYVLTYLQQQEEQSPLVRVLKDKRRGVTKGDVEKKYRRIHSNDGELGVTKRIALDATSRNPDLIAQYKAEKTKHPPAAISHETLADATDTEAPDFDMLLSAVVSLDPGARDADAYEKAIEQLLSALFYPSLVNPTRQREIHEGRKRIDINFTNMGRTDFFYWLANHYPAANVVVECKNYSRPLANPEFDQLSGRFSPSRGKYGILVYRSFSDKRAIMNSMRDTARDDRGFITPLDDDDLEALVEEHKVLGRATLIDGLLHKRFHELVD